MIVHALVRPESELHLASENLHRFTGEMNDLKDVKRTLRGCHMVLCLFGPRPPYTDIFCSRATRVILEAMEALCIPRIICQSGAMIGDYPANRSVAFAFLTRSANHKMHEMMEDRKEQEFLITSSSLDYTIVKPPRLLDKPGKKIAVGEDLIMKLNSSLSRQDLADWLIQEIVSPAWHRKIVFIKN